VGEWSPRKARPYPMTGGAYIRLVGGSREDTEEDTEGGTA
jgi:hypothetical protein